MSTRQNGPSGRTGPERGLARVTALAVAVGLVGISAVAPAQAAIEPYNPFSVNQGFSILATGDAMLNNGELEGSVAAFGAVSTTKSNYPVIHQAAGDPAYSVPTVDGDPTRVLAESYVGTGGMAVTNRDDSGTIDPGSPEATAIAKLADTSNLTASARGSNFTRLTNTEQGTLDLEDLPYDPATWQSSVQTQQASVADYFPDLDAHVAQANQCLAAMYTDPALGNEVTLTGDANEVFASGFSTTVPNWLDYEDVAGRVIKMDDADGYRPTAQAPLVVRVSDPTNTVGPLNFEGLNDQELARYIMLDLSEATSPVTMDGLEYGAVWAPGIDLTYTSSRTTNGQWFSDDFTSGGASGTGGGELHHHTFLGELLCEVDDAEPAITSQAAVAGSDDGLLPTDGGTVVDTVSYTGLEPGTEYVVTATVMTADGTDTGITGTATFTPTTTPPTTSGSVDVSIDVTPEQAAGYAGQDLVIFQSLTADGTEVATHEDLDDPDQTFTVAAIPATGGFDLVKSVDGDGAALVDPTTTFTVDWAVTDGPSTGRTGTLEVQADGTVVEGPDDLVEGDMVTFTEETPPVVDGTEPAEVTISPNPLTIDPVAPTTPVVTVTNTYDKSDATFSIHKEITGDAADLVPPGTEFTVEWEVTAGADVGDSGTLTVPADGTVVDGPALAHGDAVTFSEPEFPEVEGVVWGTPTITPNPLVLDAGEEVDVVVDNEAVPEQLEGGTIEIAKTVDGDGAGIVYPDFDNEDCGPDGNQGGGNDEECADPPSYTIGWTVTDGPSTGRTGEVTVTGDGEVSAIPGEGEEPFQVGDVVEFDEPTGPDTDGAELAGVTFDPSSVLIVPGPEETVTVDVANTYDLDDATFTAHKEITGSAADLVPADAEFDLHYEVTEGLSAGTAGTLSLPADGTVVQGPTLKHGDVVTFSEDTPPVIDGVVWGGVTIDPESITLDSAAETVDVTVTNTAEAVPAISSQVAVAGQSTTTVPGGGGTVVDTISYENLVPGTEYTVSGLIATPDGESTGLTGGPVAFVPTEPDGTVDVEFEITLQDAMTYAGQDLVALQTVWLDGEPVAVHADPADPAQTFSVEGPAPTISSEVTVLDSDDGTVQLTGGTVVDTIAYTGLTPGREYTVAGAVILDGLHTTGIVGATAFTPDAPDGTVDVTFEITAEQAALYAGTTVVAFQAVFLDAELVAGHDDFADEAQTFAFAGPTPAPSPTPEPAPTPTPAPTPDDGGELPVTGPEGVAGVLVVAGISLLAGTILLLLRRRRLLG